jgi:hypothetical protein
MRMKSLRMSAHSLRRPKKKRLILGSESSRTESRLKRTV